MCRKTAIRTDVVCRKNASDLLTLREEQVRSKSEIIIADALFHAKVPYRYEYPVYVRGRSFIYTMETSARPLSSRLVKQLIEAHFL